MTQAVLAERARLSQTMVSRLERGFGASASLETWALASAAAGEQLVAFLERSPGSSPPRDAAHLRNQELVIAHARPGGWRARPELTISTGGPRPRSIDVLLDRPVRNELAVVEVWDLLDDVGAAFRTLDEKQLAVAARHPDRVVGGLWVVRGTRRNRRLVAAHPGVFAARFAGSSAAWLAALMDPSTPMPEEAGLLWADVAGSRLLGWQPDRSSLTPPRRRPRSATGPDARRLRS